MGIHHITAIVDDPQENVDFYAGILGLRLVKKTINFDDPGTYHLYFGDGGGKPGTIMTFFPWPGARPGKIGSGQVGITPFVVPKGALIFWEDRLKKYNVTITKNHRFSESYLEFDDPHGLHLEIVEREEGQNSDWDFGGITKEVAIKGEELYQNVRIDSKQLQPVSRLAGNFYSKLGEEIEMKRLT